MFETQYTLSRVWCLAQSPGGLAERIGHTSDVAFSLAPALFMSSFPLVTVDNMICRCNFLDLVFFGGHKQMSQVAIRLRLEYCNLPLKVIFVANSPCSPSCSFPIFEPRFVTSD